MNVCHPAFDLIYLLTAAGFIAGGYLVGSLPVAWLLTKLLTGKDLRTLGSGNAGVMNTAVSTARWAGLLVFLAEVGKGVLAAALPPTVGCGEEITALSIVAVVCGTRWSVWLNFKGGRGNTAGMSALCLVSWYALAFLLAVWFLARLLTRNSFKATRLILLILPLDVWWATRSWTFGLMGFVLALIYLEAQRVKSDDHLYIKHKWNSIWGFLTTPARRG